MQILTFDPQGLRFSSPDSLGFKTPASLGREGAPPYPKDKGKLSSFAQKTRSGEGFLVHISTGAC